MHGNYLNPRSTAYKDALNSDIYVDKSGLIKQINKRICTKENFIASTRARRFGKSMTLQMISAYYGIGEDTHKLFADKEVS